MSSNILNEVNKSLKNFGALDYAVFAIMLLVSSCIGLYFGYKDKVLRKKNEGATQGSSAINYLLGGKNLNAFPVAMSLVATSLSGVALLGESSEVYVYGMQYAFILSAPIVMGVFAHYIIIPVFYELNAISIFEYFEKRFDMKMRLLGSLISTLSMITFHAIVIYVPALAFNQTTGIDIHIISPVVMAVCVFYTCLGGIKAVIWTDVFQMVLMISVMILIVIKGTIDAGGLDVVIGRNLESGRIEAPDFSIDPTIRHSFWTLSIGGSCFRIIATANQSIVQRFLSLKDQKTAQKASAIYALGLIVLVSLNIFSGLVLYATFHDCDPLTTKLAKAQDQLLPILVMRVLSNFPGLTGFFVAGVFSAALSTLSSGLNSLSALVLEDYFKPMFKGKISEKFSGYIMRSTVLIFGLISVGLVYVVQHLGSVLQLSISILSTFAGSLFGAFFIGLFLPWIGKKATFYGALVSSTIMMYVVIRSQLDMANGLIIRDIKPTSIEGCHYNFTLTRTPGQENFDYQKGFHNVSYLYFTPLGAIITCLSAFTLSFIFGFEDPHSVDPRLLAPFIRKYFSPKILELPKNSNDEIQ